MAAGHEVRSAGAVICRLEEGRHADVCLGGLKADRSRMGTWISHLRIAENLLAQIPGLDEVAFAYGNLAPDSGLPNADWTIFDPPKTVTHFLRVGEDEGQI